MWNFYQPFLYYTSRQGGELLKRFKSYIEQTESDKPKIHRCSCGGPCLEIKEDYFYDFWIKDGREKHIYFQNIPAQICVDCKLITFDLHTIEFLEKIHDMETLARFENNEILPDNEIIDFDELVQVISEK